MAYLNQPDYVRYACNCGSLKPISKIYFCRHCLKIRCGYCVCQEVDLQYCSNCMENLSSSEIRVRKNKCSNCFDCPCCFQILSTRLGLPVTKHPVGAEAKEGKEGKDVKPVTHKVYYLVCGLCRWSSRDAGMPDQSVVTGGWPEQENPHTIRINALIDYHKVLASLEKKQKEKKQFQPKRSYLQYESYGATSAMIRKRIGQPLKLTTQMQVINHPQSAIASEEVDELPPEIFTKPCDVSKITTLEQRLQQPDMQVEKINELRPQNRRFLIKRSQRCRVCEHNLSKPDLYAQSTKFKIQLSAFYHVPEVKIVTFEPLSPGKSSELLLKFCNPTQHPTQIMLLPLDTPTTTIVVDENIQETENSNSTPVGRQIQVVEDPKPISVIPNADLSLPHSSLILPPRDDAAEYDDTGDTHIFQDDPKLVVWRKGNKAVIRLHVTPCNDEPSVVGFVLQYGYVNTIATLDNKIPQKVDLKVQLYLTLNETDKNS